MNDAVYSRVHNTGQNLNTGISVLLIYETKNKQCATIPGKAVGRLLRLILVTSTVCHDSPSHIVVIELPR